MNDIYWYFVGVEIWNFGMMGGLLQMFVDFGFDMFGRYINGYVVFKSGSVFNRNLYGYFLLYRCKLVFLVFRIKGMYFSRGKSRSYFVRVQVDFWGVFGCFC